MKLKIVGSGGMFQIPNPFCSCPICQEARRRRGAISGWGRACTSTTSKCSSTHTRSRVQAGISEIRYLSLSHKDPDHTRGMRIVEPLGYDCIADRGSPISFIALPEVVDDINAWNGDGLRYYEEVLHCISIHRTNHLKIGRIEIDLVNNRTHRGNMTFYVLTEGDKKAIYACCDIKPFVHNDLYAGADVLIVGLVSDDGILRDGSLLRDAPFRQDMFTLEEIMEIKRRYAIGRIVVTHIDEYWGKSYAHYRRLERFARSRLLRL